MNRLGMISCDINRTDRHTPSSIRSKATRIALFFSVLLLGACANNFTPTQDHSVAYNVAHSIGLKIDDVAVPASQRQRGTAATVADAALLGTEAAVPLSGGSGGLGVGVGAASFAGSMLRGDPNGKEYIIAWVPGSLAPNVEQAHQLILKLYMEALYAEAGDGFALDLRPRIPQIGLIGCEKNRHGDFPIECGVGFLRDEEITGGDHLSPPPYFVQVAEPVYGPIARANFLVGQLREKFSPDIDRVLAERVSKRLPPWMFLYLPGRKNHTTLVLQAGKPLYFVAP